MKLTLFKSLLVFLLLFLICSRAVAGVEYVYIEVKGFGITEKDAVYDALKNALEQIKGLKISVERETYLKSVIKNVNGENSTKFEKLSCKNVNTTTKGAVQQYRIISSFEEPDGGWTVSVEATIAKYVTSLQGNKIKLAVIPFRTNSHDDELLSFSRQLRQAIVGSLTQKRTFFVVDREYLQEQQSELDFLEKEDVPIEEMARIGNKLGVDVIVVGTVEKLIHYTNTITLKRTGIKISTTNCGVEFFYSIIEIATGRIMLSDSYRRTNKIKGSSCNYYDIASRAASSIAKQIETVFPISVVAVSGRFVTLGQGGKTIHSGQRFKLIRCGRELINSKNGDYLGREETPVGLIEIVDVQYKISRAKILKINMDIEKEFVSGDFIVRQIVENKRTNNAKRKKANKRVEVKRKIINKDDW